MYVCNPALQPLRMFREELEFGAVTFRMLPGVVITNLSWRTDQKIKVIHKHSEQTKVKSGVYYAAVSTVVLLPVETGWTCPGLFVFLHAILHSLGWPWCWFFSARRSWPGSPSLIHQPLLQGTSLSVSTVLSLMLAVPPHLMCAVFVYVSSHSHLIQLTFYLKIYVLGRQYLSDRWNRGHGKQRSWTQRGAESGVSHFHLSPSITLKDVGSQHGRIRGFTKEPTVVEVSLNLQEDKISTKKSTKIMSDGLTGLLIRILMIPIYLKPLIQLHSSEKTQED